MLCSHPVFGTRMYDKLTDWDNFLDGIPTNRRYTLLRLCFKESTRIDIDMRDDLKNVKGSLSDVLLNRLKPDEALSLYVRLRKARGIENLAIVCRVDSILSTAPAFGGSGVDPDLF